MKKEFTHRERSGMRSSHRMPRRESLVNNDNQMLKNIRAESRLNAIERHRLILADEVIFLFWKKIIIFTFR